MSFLGSAFKIIDPSQLFHLQVPNFGKLTREGIYRGDESSKVKYVTRNCYCRRCVRPPRRRSSSDRTRRGARSRTKSGSHRLRSSMGGSGVGRELSLPPSHPPSHPRQLRGRGRGVGECHERRPLYLVWLESMVGTSNWGGIC